MFFILLSASSYSSVHSKFTSFLKILKKGRACRADLKINMLKVVNIPFNFMICSLFEGGYIARMSLHLSRIALITLSMR